MTNVAVENHHFCKGKLTISMAIFAVLVITRRYTELLFLEAWKMIILLFDLNISEFLASRNTCDLGTPGNPVSQPVEVTAVVPADPTTQDPVREIALSRSLKYHPSSGFNPILHITPLPSGKLTWLSKMAQSK